MSVKVFKTNKAGKIEFTRCELEKLLSETYNEGYHDGENHEKNTYWTWASPSVVNTIPCCGTTHLNAANKDEAKKISVQTHGELKDGKMDVSTKVRTSDSPEKVYELKGMNYNMDDLAKTIDTFLNSKVDLFTAKSISSDNPFSNLAKELAGL